MENRIKVVYLEPGKEAVITQIGTSLESLQEAVGGYIEAFYPFTEEVCIVCNDEGKINGMELNRTIRDEDGTILDIIAGPCFLCDCSGEDFGSLNEEQLARYLDLYRLPEHFFRKERGITVIPYHPTNH